MSEIVHYVWKDADDNEVSPVHRDLGAAISFRVNWNKRWLKLLRRFADNHGGINADFVPEHLLTPMTKTGKPPVTLERVITQTWNAPLNDAEVDVIETIVDADIELPL